MGGFTDAQIDTLSQVIIAGACNTPVQFEKVCNYVWSQMTPADADEGQPGFIYSASGGEPQDINGVGAAILAQMALSTIDRTRGGIAYALEQLERAVTCYPYDRAVNPPSYQMPNLPAGAPGP